MERITLSGGLWTEELWWWVLLDPILYSAPSSPGCGCVWLVGYSIRPLRGGSELRGMVSFIRREKKETGIFFSRAKSVKKAESWREI